jgi:hypothetical protein
VAGALLDVFDVVEGFGSDHDEGEKVKACASRRKGQAEFVTSRPSPAREANR